MTDTPRDIIARAMFNAEPEAQLIQRPVSIKSAKLADVALTALTAAGYVVVKGQPLSDTTPDLIAIIARTLYEAVLEGSNGYVEGQESDYTPDPTHPEESIMVDSSICFVDLAAAVINVLKLRQKWNGRLGVTDHWHVVGDAWIEGQP